MFERSCLRQRRLLTFVGHSASREVSRGMLIKVCRARIFFKLLCFLHYPLTRCEAIFSQDVAKEGRQLSGISYVPLRVATCLRYSTFPLTCDVILAGGGGARHARCHPGEG